MGRREDMDAAAAGWVIRLRDADEQDWSAFAAWLEADPAHNDAYEEAALAEAEWDGLAPPGPLAAPEPAYVVPRRAGGRRWFLGGGIAAALAAAIGFGTLQTNSSPYAVDTAAGERRSITLPDGSRIDLNGNSRILLDRDEPRFARLERGEALFTVVHDESDPFEVRVGDTLLRDMGTTFNVVSEGDRLDVAVAEGVVEVDPGRSAVTLTQGMALQRQGRSGRVTRRAPEAVTGWRQGRLSYASASVGQVAADLSRNLGVPVEAAPQVAGQPFTGVIQLDAGPETIQRAALLMGVGARRSNGGWTLTAGVRDTP